MTGCKKWRQDETYIIMDSIEKWVDKAQPIPTSLLHDRSDTKPCRGVARGGFDILAPYYVKFIPY